MTENARYAEPTNDFGKYFPKKEYVRAPLPEYRELKGSCPLQFTTTTVMD